MGMLKTKSIPDLALVKDYLINSLLNKNDLVKDCFQYIVDSGCAATCSPYEKDFVYLLPLKKPIVLKGVTGEQECSHGGITNIR